MLNPQLKGMLALITMTGWNGLMGFIMIAELMTVPEGMIISFAGMIFICLISMFGLMGTERPWRRPSYRKNKNVS